MSDMPKKLVNCEHLNLIARKLNSKIKEQTNYLNNIDYDNLLAFDTSEIVFDNVATTSMLGKASLGQMVLGSGTPNNN